MGSGRMKLRYMPYELRFRHVFEVAAGARSSTPVVFTAIDYEGFTGYGEASMPPYLGESSESVTAFLSKADLSIFADPLNIEELVDYLERLAPGNYAAKASVDIALHDLAGKLLGKPWYTVWGLGSADAPSTSFTIGIDRPEIVREKVKEAEQFRFLKVKVSKGNEEEMIASVREMTDRPLFVDVNQGWTDKKYALDMIYYFLENNVVMIEQPLPADMTDELEWITVNSPLPVIADEGIKTIDDLIRASDFYSGINIKLMKCGGMHNGWKMLQEAKKRGLKTMIGCMSETSCGISAAAQLSPAADWADLDGNLLIINDMFKGVEIADGRIILSDKPGIGALPRDVDFFL
jgi:L-alanine-DL-glutamate epimerase-like enolase superfamily enzyme